LPAGQKSLTITGMEALVYFVMSNGTMVITVLFVSIILCVFGLLIMSFHNPKEAIASEVGNIDRLEGVLRQMLSEQSWPQASAVVGEPNANNIADDLLKEQVKTLETELHEKQKQIDALSNGQPVSMDAAPMKQKIKDLEEKLAEYSVIEEDIAVFDKKTMIYAKKSLK